MYIISNVYGNIMIQLHFFDLNDVLFLTYVFEGEQPSKNCHVTNRLQGLPSRHRCSIVVDGTELVSKKQGYVLTKEGKSKDRHLPIQKTARLINPLMGMTIDAQPTANTSKRVWKQFGRVRVQFERLDTFYEVRDNMWDGTVNIYHPIRVVL